MKWRHEAAANTDAKSRLAMLEQNELAGLEDSVYMRQRPPVGLYEPEEDELEEEKEKKAAVHSAARE